MIKEEGKLVYIKDGELKEVSAYLEHEEWLDIEIIAMIDGEEELLCYFKYSNKWMQMNKDFDKDDPNSYQYLPYDKYEIKEVIFTKTIK